MIEDLALGFLCQELCSPPPPSMFSISRSIKQATTWKLTTISRIKLLHSSNIGREAPKRDSGKQLGGGANIGDLSNSQVSRR